MVDNELRAAKTRLVQRQGYPTVDDVRHEVLTHQREANELQKKIRLQRAKRLQHEKNIAALKELLSKNLDHGRCVIWQSTEDTSLPGQLKRCEDRRSKVVPYSCIPGMDKYVPTATKNLGEKIDTAAAIRRIEAGVGNISDWRELLLSDGSKVVVEPTMAPESPHKKIDPQTGKPYVLAVEPTPAVVGVREGGDVPAAAGAEAGGGGGWGALNALNDELVGTLISKLQAFDEDDTVRAIVVTGHSPSPEAGTEKAFAAGADIKQMNEKSYAEVNKSDMLGFWNDIKKIRKPVIAAVNGFALGGGCELAMACDIIVASEDAKFGQPEIKLGTIPGCGGTQRLSQAVGKSRAMWWVLSGEMISADEALRSGLVAKVFPKAELLPKALEMASKIAQFSSPVLNMAKDCVNQSTNLPLDQGLLFERRVFHATWGLADRKEGMTAFAEKRAAVFKNE
eukprot:g5758.t1